MQLLLESLLYYWHHDYELVGLKVILNTFLTIGEAPISGIKSTVDKNNSRPLRRFSKNAGLNLATEKY
jgi:hypothetical protein